MLKRIFLSFTVLMLTLVAFGQTKATEAADALFTSEQYNNAIEAYKKAYSTESSVVQKARIIFQVAECYRLMANPTVAVNWYEKSIKAKHQNLKQYYYLADCLKQSGKFKEAIVKFGDYKKYAPKDAELADKGIADCNLAIELKAKPSRFVVQNELVLNSPNLDIAPAFLDKKENTIIFTSSREGSSGNKIDQRVGENFSDLWISTKDKKGKWSEPVLLEGVNTEVNEGAAKLNAKRNEMYFTRCLVEKKENLGCDICKANITGGKVSNIVVADQFKGADEKTINVAHPTINKADNLIIFTSDLPGGQGGKDLWMVVFDKKSKSWSKPQNLGPKINTEQDENFPFIDEDNTLYFSSNGHPGIGGFDVFKAKLISENRWGDVENMLAPINSEKDDYGVYFTEIGTRGFFTSNRPGGRGKDDIYSFFFPPIQLVLKGTVYDKDGGKPVAGAEVKVTGGDGFSFEKITDAEGVYEFADNQGKSFLNPETDYVIEVAKKDYLQGRDNINTRGIAESVTFVQDFSIQFAPPNKAIKMPEVQYALGKWELLENSKDSLNFLFDIMSKNPQIVVELKAHTDSRGDDNANLELSQKRAQSCVDYLIVKGIAKDRLVAKGYGETQLKISDSEIDAVSDKAEQEKLHQVNRRTEFSVIKSDYVPGQAAPAETPAKEEGK